MEPERATNGQMSGRVRWMATVSSSTVALSLLVSTMSAGAADEIILTSGPVLTGELQDASLTLRMPHSTYQISRDTVRRIVFGAGGIRDTVELRNGSRLPGVVEQGRYALRLASGEVRVVDRRDIEVIVLGGARPATASGLTDVVILADGRHVYGELLSPGFDVVPPSGSQRFARDSVWQIVLGTAVGDSTDLATGDRLSGVVGEAGYTIRTPDGQTLTFARNEVAEVVLARRAAGGPGAAPGGAPGPSGAPGAGPAAPGPTPPAPAPGPSVAVVPPTALPAPIRSVLRDVAFAFDRSDLTPEARQSIQELATALKGFPTLSLLVEGHADERGTAEYNLALGTRRAEAVKGYLVSLGIDPARIDMISYGSERPLDPEHTETAWALNRRAHFVVRSR
jgi:peptidoglycan-associated lipoprotein